LEMSSYGGLFPRKTSDLKKRLAGQAAGEAVHVKNDNGRAADGSSALYDRTAVFEMVLPLIYSGVEQSGQLL